MNANAWVFAGGTLALWIIVSSAGCSSEPESTPGDSGSPTNAGPSTSGGVSSTTAPSTTTATGVGGAPAGSSAVVGSTSDTSSSGLGGVSAVAGVDTSTSAGGASSATGAGGATADSTTGASTTGGDATLTDDQCSGISNGAACETEGTCAPRACGLADTGSRTCTCAGAVWDCTSCAWTEPYPPVVEPPTEPLPACAGTEADEVPCETSGDRCDTGDEVCACWLEEDGQLIWDCDSAPSFWD